MFKAFKIKKKRVNRKKMAENKPKTLEDVMQDEKEEEELPEEIRNASVQEIQAKARVIENEIRNLKSAESRLKGEIKKEELNLKDNTEKVKMNKQLPYLVANVVEVSIFLESIKSKILNHFYLQRFWTQ